ncbi:MAG TPA: hypothetical protein VKA26_02590 [Ignavibacteriaceae bacterium]|nr:hypothetical protein [Ignavibacteriaceae bacterium]
MKKLFIVLFCLISINLLAQQEVNYLTKDSSTGKPMLLGYCTRDAFNDSSFSWWYNSEYNMYEVDSTALQNAAEELNDKIITIVMGTWCSDSRSEVPKFYKILDYLNYPTDSVKLIMVGRNKKGKNGEVKDLDIQRVPTFIFYDHNKEIGRIIEYPEESLDRDMMKILGNK